MEEYKKVDNMYTQWIQQWSHKHVVKCGCISVTKDMIIIFPELKKIGGFVLINNDDIVRYRNV